MNKGQNLSLDLIACHIYWEEAKKKKKKKLEKPVTGTWWVSADTGHLHCWGREGRGGEAKMTPFGPS